MPSDAKALMQKIDALPPEGIAEVGDFADFLGQREGERALARDARDNERARLRRNLEQSRGRRLRCPLSSRPSGRSHERLRPASACSRRRRP